MLSIDRGANLSFADADIAQVVYDAGAIAERVGVMGAEIARDFAGRRPVLVSVLKGAVPLVADLSRAIGEPHELDFIAVSSFGPHAPAQGSVRLIKDLDRSIEGRDVILVEDVVDTGLTLAYVLRTLRTRRPRSIAVGALLDKPAHRFVDIPIQYRGFETADAFYVGYGLDFLQRYRNLPFIGVLRPELLTRLPGSPAGGR